MRPLQNLGLLRKRFLKRFIGHGGGTVKRHTETEITLLGDAFLFANQPIGVQLKLHFRVGLCGFKLGANFEGGHQHDGAFVAVVGQRSNRDFLGGRPN